MIIREAIAKDIPQIAQVHVDTSRIAYRGIFPDEVLANLSYEKREQGWHQVFNNSAQDGNFTYVAEERSGKIIGFANGGIEREGVAGYQGELYAIYILESHQQRGIGRELVRVVAARLNQMEFDSMLVWVLEDNPASNFYQKLGGKEVVRKEIERARTKMIKIAYGWKNTSNLQHSSEMTQ